MSSIQGITEDDIANYLLHTPGFFERHAEVLAQIQLSSPHGQRAVSLQERQMEMLREKIRGLEQKLVEMIRNGQDHLMLADKQHRWLRALMRVRQPADLPEVLVAALQREFLVPLAAIRLWGTGPALADESWAQPVSEDIRALANRLGLPSCGTHAGFDVAAWLGDTPASLALIPLRPPAGGPAFGLLVLGSPDPTRYRADMGTDFLVRIAELAGASLQRLLPDPAAD